jgi:hypothetical protein
MTIPLRNWALPAALLLAFAVFAKCQQDASQRALGAAIERNAMLRDSLTVARTEGRRIDTVHLRDTVTLRRIETRTVTLLDTLLHSDTVVLTRRESVLVFAADSLVRACRAAIGSCEATAINLREQLSLTTQQRDLWQRRAQPSLWDQIKQLPGRAASTAAIASVGYAACVVTR